MEKDYVLNTKSSDAESSEIASMNNEGIGDALDEASSYFVCTSINKSTFVIHEKDKFDEHPFIYAKVYNDIPVLVISDTGCGGGVGNYPHSSDLKDFLETYPVPSNSGKPLNPRDTDGLSSKIYMIICTHCHYDHILGLKHFKDSSTNIVASREGRSFVENDLPEHSLCRSLGIATPRYEVTNWAKDNDILCFDGKSLDLQIIHTPGHTPDEIAWYDRQERHLYVGDSFYERVAKDKSYEQAIIFPKEGNIIDYLQSLNKLLLFVEARNTENDGGKDPIRIGCGHVTSSVDGKVMLKGVRKLFLDILEEKVPVVLKESKREEEVWTWREDGEPRYSVTAPERIMHDAQQAWSHLGELRGDITGLHPTIHE